MQYQNIGAKEQLNIILGHTTCKFCGFGKLFSLSEVLPPYL